MKLLMIVPFFVLTSCSMPPLMDLEEGECITADFRYLSGLDATHGKVLEVYDDSKFIFVLNSKNEKVVVDSWEVSRTDCSNYEKALKRGM